MPPHTFYGGKLDKRHNKMWANIQNFSVQKPFYVAYGHFVRGCLYGIWFRDDGAL